MPRERKIWFRFYVEAFPDPKMRRLPAGQRWVFAAACGAARMSPEPGRLLVAEGLTMTIEELADFAGVTKRDAQQAVSALIQLGSMHMDGDVMVVTRFRDRQFESDNVSDRTAKHRSRERSLERSNDVRENDDGTSPGTRLSRALATETEDRDRTVTTQGRDRSVTSPADERDEPTCSRHPDGDGGTACGGCARVREWRDRNQARVAAAREHERSQALLREISEAKTKAVPRPTMKAEAS